MNVTTSEFLHQLSLQIHEQQASANFGAFDEGLSHPLIRSFWISHAVLVEVVGVFLLISTVAVSASKGIVNKQSLGNFT